jgi:hypothetical protein
MFLAWKKIAQCFAVVLLISMAAGPALAEKKEEPPPITGEELDKLNDALTILQKEIPNAEANIPSAAVKKAEDDLNAKATKNLSTPKENKQEKDKAQKDEDEAKKAADDAKAKENAAGQKKAVAYRAALEKIRQAQIIVETLSEKIILGKTFTTKEMRLSRGRSTALIKQIKKLLEMRPTAMRTDSPPGSGTES